MENRGVSSTVKLPVSKTGLGGSNPSAPARILDPERVQEDLREKAVLEWQRWQQQQRQTRVESATG